MLGTHMNWNISSTVRLIYAFDIVSTSRKYLASIMKSHLPNMTVRLGR